jgi:hypothetical protein
MVASLVISIFLVSVVVSMHYEGLSLISRLVGRIRVRPRARIVVGVIGALAVHIAEIWVFAVAYYFAIKLDFMGSLSGNVTGAFLDCTYYSFVTYTSVGFGDITPIGPLRFMTATEALTGLVLIAWTASFLFIQMQKHWDAKA